MDSYEHIAERFWNLKQKAAEEEERESLYMDDVIQKAHLDREIALRLDGVATVFDGGAGTGRFSIPLAERGLHVTHFDISRPMLESARRRAEARKVSANMDFVLGGLTDLSRFSDSQFDLVLSFDAPISYTYPSHLQVIRELARIAAKAIVISVSCRYGYAAYCFNPMQKDPFLVSPGPSGENSIREKFENWEPNWDEISELMNGGLQARLEDTQRAYDEGESPWPVNYLFTPEELKASLESSGVRDLRLSGPGALARTMPREALVKLLYSERRIRFLDFCHHFDSLPSVLGLAKDNLVASGAVQ